MESNHGTKQEAAVEAGGDAKRRREENGASNGPEKANSDASSDDEVDLDIQKMIDQAQGKVGQQSPKSGAGDSDSSDSSSSSSSSSTSSSSSSSISQEEYQQEYADDAYSMAGSEAEGDIPIVLTEGEKLTRDWEACKKAQLTRKDLLWCLYQLPPEEAMRAIQKAWVRITLQVGVCVLAQVTDLAEEEPYHVDAGAGNKQEVKVSLRCRRCMPPERNYKLIYVSNQEITRDEFEQWTKLVKHHGMEVDPYRSNWREKVKDISAARAFKFDEVTVTKMLNRKTEMGIDIEFNAQKESRMRSEVQAAVSQMVLCGLKDSRASELEKRDRQAQENMMQLTHKSAKHQEEWFEKRPHMFSIKEINVKNKTRQVARDKHALEHTYAMEEEVEVALREGRHVDANPFERRACRPVSAWDTKLTTTEGLDNGEAAKEAKAAEDAAKAAAKAAAAAAADSSNNGQATKAASGRVDMRAHRQLWSMISGTATKDAAKVQKAGHPNGSKVAQAPRK